METQISPVKMEPLEQDNSIHLNQVDHNTNFEGLDDSVVTPKIPENHATEKEIPPPSEDFLSIFDSLPIVKSEHYDREDFCNQAWKQYYSSCQHVVLEGNSSAWIACAIYSQMISKKITHKSCSLSLANILSICGISAMEFFDKMERWTETISGPKRMREQLQRVQSALAVSAVVYKKFLKIFRTLFSYVESDNGFGSSELLRLIWTMFLVLKKSLPAEDLINSFHLLLCVIEHIYGEVCVSGPEEHVNNEFAQQLLDSCEGVLDYLCRSFDGIVLDAKHFRTHWYTLRKDSILFQGKESENHVISKHKSLVNTWGQQYIEIVVKRAELDERIFLPSSAEKVFDSSFDCSPIELLKRGGNDSSFADAELLLRMSTQNCLEKLVDHKALVTPLSAKSYVISSDQLCPLTPLSSSLHNVSKLNSLIPPNWSLDGSFLHQCCQNMRDNPLTTIVHFADSLAQRFEEEVQNEGATHGVNYDPNISLPVGKHCHTIIQLFYILMEKIAKYEMDKNPGRDLEFSNVFRKEEFLSSVFVCAIELVLFSYGSIRVFPWSVKLFNLPPISFHKVIEVIIRASEGGLSRGMVKHLNRKEEEVLEELAWSTDSPIWGAINKRPDCVPSCSNAWNQSRQLSKSYSPAKRRRLDEDVVQPTFGSSTATAMFFRKVYYICCVRLTDICDRIRIDDKGRKMVWTLLEYVLRSETRLLAGRHLDQNLLCIIYVVVKSLKLSCTFMDIVSHYRHQPQSRSPVYREVNVHQKEFSEKDVQNDQNVQFNDSEVCKVDLIKYYNLVFLKRVEDFVKKMDKEESSGDLLLFPQPRGFGLSPVKRSLGDRVSVLPLTSSTSQSDRQYKYNIHSSPRKDLQNINRVVSMGHQPAFYGVSEVAEKAYSHIFRR